jgi:hypothetical protein
MEATEPLMGYRWFDPKLYLVNHSKTKPKMAATNAIAENVSNGDDVTRAANEDSVEKKLPEET